MSSQESECAGGEAEGAGHGKAGDRRGRIISLHGEAAGVLSGAGVVEHDGTAVEGLHGAVVVAEVLLGGVGFIVNGKSGEALEGLHHGGGDVVLLVEHVPPEALVAAGGSLQYSTLVSARLKKSCPALADRAHAHSHTQQK